MQGIVYTERTDQKKPLKFDFFVTFSSESPAVFYTVPDHLKTVNQSEPSFEKSGEGESRSSDEVHEHLEPLRPTTIQLNSRSNSGIAVIHEKWISESTCQIQEDVVMNNALKYVYKSFPETKVFTSHFDFRQPFHFSYCSSTKHLFEINTTTYTKEAIIKGHQYFSGIHIHGCLVMANVQSLKPHIVTFAETVSKPALIQPKKKENSSESSKPDVGFTSINLESELASSSLKIRSFPVLFEPHVKLIDGTLIKRQRVFASDANRIVYVTQEKAFALFQVPNLQLKVCPVECEELNDVCIKSMYIFWLDHRGLVGRHSIYLDKKTAKTAKLELAPTTSALLLQSSDRFLFVLTQEAENKFFLHSLTNTNLKSLKMPPIEVDCHGGTGYMNLKTFESDRSLATLLTATFAHSFTLFNVCVSSRRFTVITKLLALKTEDAESISHVDFSNFSIVLCFPTAFKCFLVNF